MKIGIDGRCLQSGENTGVQEYTKGLVLQLLKENPKDDFVIFVNAFGKIKGDFTWLKDFNNIKIKRFNWPNKVLNFLFWFLKWPKIDKMLGGVDIFVIPNFNFVALNKKVKQILTVHDLSFERFPETFSFKRRLWHFLINPRKATREANKIWAVSNSTAQDLINLYQVDKHKIVVNYPFFNLKEKKQNLEKIRLKYKLPENFFLFLGTVEPRKNIEGVIEGFEIFRKRNQGIANYKLVIAGGTGWLWKSILKRAQQSAYFKDIFFIGFVDEVDKSTVYSLATVFVYPSLYEGFGFPPLEAMASGVPTIASNCSSIPEVLEDGVILINPYPAFDISLALEILMKNKKTYQLYSEKGFSRFKKIEKIKRNFKL